jgi:hypothetical protein
MALAQVGVDFMTVMGFGRIRYLAQHLDISTEKLSKPSPVQSLAGIAACWSGEEWPAIQWAYNAYLRNQKPPHERGMLTAWDLPPSFQLHIFEDTIGGILAGQGAARLLRDLGYQVDVHVWGIAKNQAKYASLERAGARIFRNVNEAIMASRPVFLDG